MVQRKSPEKKSYGRVDRQLSSDLHQDGCGGVGADLEKKRKKVRSMKISGFERSPMDFQIKKTAFTPTRNYMKPTRSSDARKGELQVTATSPASTDKKKSPRSSKNSNSVSSSSSSSSPAASVKRCSTITSCAKKNLNRATCSSTLKNSKFPAALVLNPEGTSKMRVCPYTYCSLNGHMHEFSSPPPPPLKCFISERRNLLKNQRSVEIETLFSVKTKNNEEEKVGEERPNDIIEIPSDLFAEIYTIPPEEIIVEKNCDEINIQGERDEEQYCVFDENQCCDVMDQTSEYSRGELDDTMANFLEYVEIDSEGEAQEASEFEENGDTKNSDIEAMDMDWEAEDDPEGEEMNSHVTDKNKSQSILDKAQKQPPPEGSETEHTEVVLDANSSPETANLEPSEDESSNLEAVSGTTETTLNASSIDLKETGGILSSKWSISRKMTAEEFEQAKEFNPKPPNFLPLEPDPEAEKVDLKHQMMDGRRSAEEWMLDYALQHAVTKLGGAARKKKVALLVEAFETVVPLHTCETPLSHGTSSFTNLSFIQACS